MKNVKNKPNLSEWSLAAVDEVNEFISAKILKAASEAIEYAFNDDETHAYFPAIWINEEGSKYRSTNGLGGAPVKDPLTIYLRVALNGANDNLPTYEFNLRDILSADIDCCSNGGGQNYALAKISNALKELANVIDLEISYGGKENGS